MINSLLTASLSVLLAAASSVACAAGASSQSDASARSSVEWPAETPRRPVATYSIIARDGRTGEMGVAVQSHWFSVGGVVPWAKAGVGVVATQSLVNPSYGPDGLDLMESGLSARDALRQVTEADDGRAYRQVGFVDAEGQGAAMTGDKCIRHADHQMINLGGGSVVIAMANMMDRQFVPEAMLRGYSTGGDAPLAERLLSALEGAEKAGGDIRGKQSAAILVVRAESTGDEWEDKLVDLRVEDHPDPVAELGRLLQLHRAYEHMNEGDVAMEEGDVKRALIEYEAARQLAPNNSEMAFWTAVSLVNAERVEEAMPYFEQAFADEEGRWRELLRRLPDSELFPDDEELLEKILSDEDN